MLRRRPCRLQAYIDDGQLGASRRFTALSTWHAGVPISPPSITCSRQTTVYTGAQCTAARRQRQQQQQLCVGAGAHQRKTRRSVHLNVVGCQLRRPANNRASSSRTIQLTSTETRENSLWLLCRLDIPLCLRFLIFTAMSHWCVKSFT